MKRFALAAAIVLLGFVVFGFDSVAHFGAYDPAVHAGATDRLVAVAQLSDVSFEHSAAG
jgi:hypothetical protein